MNECLQIIVSGRVQGVYFRAFAQKQAQRLGLTGYVRNQPDGTVEIVACGEKNRVEQLVRWCHKGPIMAQVSKVKTRELIEEPGYDSFEII